MQFQNKETVKLKAMNSQEKLKLLIKIKSIFIEFNNKYFDLMEIHILKS